MIRVIKLLIILTVSVPVFSQNYFQTIRGTVVDKFSKTPLPGAAIVLTGSDPLRGTITDTSGNFRIDKVAIGRIDIKISFLGYNDVVLNNLELISSKELILNIELEERVYTGVEVVIYANADKSQPINKMSTVGARVFTVEESEKYAGARSDIARMVSNFAGVTGADDSRNDIVIRGNTPSGVLWRLDGLDIPNPNHFAAFGTSGGPICILRNNLLANSDFLTAAFPANYGNALAGVFDLKMITGNNETHEFIGQVAFNGIELGAEGPVNREKQSSYIIDYRYSTLDLFSKMGVQMGTGQGIPKYQDLVYKFNFPKTKTGSYSIFGLAGISKIAFLDSKKDTTQEKIDFYGSEGWDITNHSNQAVIGISHNYYLNRTSYVHSIAGCTYHNFYTTHDSVTPVTLGTFLYEGSNDLEIRLSFLTEYNKKINTKNYLKTGIKLTGYYYGLTDSVYNSSGANYLYMNDYTGSLLLLQPYALWQYKPANNFTLNSGLHFQYINFNNSYAIEPRIGVKWAFSPLMSLGLGYGMHSQMIPVTVFFNQSIMSDGSYVRTNEHLGFNKSQHFAVTYDWSMSENLRMKSELYYQYLYNIPVNGASADSYSLLNEGANFEFDAPDTLVNSGVGQNYGVELTLERFLSKGFYFLSTSSVYSSEYQGSDGVTRNTAFSGGYTINFLIGKEFNFKLRKNKEEKRKKVFVFNVKTTRSGGQRYTPVDEAASLAAQRNIYIDELAFSERFPDYWRTDLKLGYKMNGKKVTIEWSLEVTNIFDQKNVFSQTFNRKTGDAYFTYQLGRIIIPQYKIIF